MSAEDAAPIVCPDCGHENPPANRFCGGCGAKVELVEVRPEPKTTVPVAEPVAMPVETVTVASPALPEKFAALDPRQRETELQRLLTRANVERMRALLVASRKTLDEAAPIAASLGPRSVAQVEEQRGDLLAMEERWDAARACYDTARKSDPTRTLAEKKYAEMTVRLADEEALLRMGGAALRGDSIGEILSDPRAGKRNAGVAMLASSMVPGLGQVLAGQFVKGVICMAVWGICFGWIALSPDREPFVATITGFFNAKAVAKVPKEISGVTWAAMIGIMVVWFYSVFEAPLAAGKTTALAGSPNVGDKSGWEP